VEDPIAAATAAEKGVRDTPIPSPATMLPPMFCIASRHSIHGVHECLRTRRGAPTKARRVLSNIVRTLRWRIVTRTLRVQSRGRKSKSSRPQIPRSMQKEQISCETPAFTTISTLFASMIGDIWKREAGVNIMSEHLYKVIEIIGSSSESFEKAAAAAVEAAAKHLTDLRIAEIAALDMQIENDKVVSYRTKVKLSFKYHLEKHLLGV
jgi:flavin-binding protein dodecin